MDRASLYARFLKLGPLYCVALRERWMDEQWRLGMLKKESISLQGGSIPALAPVRELKATQAPKHPLRWILAIKPEL